jgi:hypothetical protein
LDGSGLETLVTNAGDSRAMVLDIVAGKMYWTVLFSGEIFRANLDGTGQELLLNVTGVTGGIDIDPLAGKMYWAGTNRISRADLDGSNVEDIIFGIDPNYVALDLAKSKIYWTDDTNLLPPALVTIDIKPGNKRNVINPQAEGGIWGAILSDTDPDCPFDPSSQVDIPTVEFGPDSATANRYKVKDINKDGLGDLLLRFKVPDTGIACGDTEATLTGETFGGQPITSSDAITTVGCR